MKSLKLTLLSFLALSLSSSAISVKAQNRDYAAVYRLLNQQNQRHLYTRDCNEKSNLVQSGFNYEGIAFYVATRQKRGTVPLHRLLLGNGGHLYTTDDQEVRSLTQNPANRYESVVGYVADSPQRNTVPLYRLLSGDHHFYTTNEAERNNYLQQNGGRLEGVAGYVWTSGSNPCGDNAPPSSGNFPVIFAQSNFQGPAEAIERDFGGRRNWEGSPNLIRSIRVPQGWYLVLYSKRNFKGESYNLNTDWSPQAGDWWNGRIRSIKVYQGAPPPQPR